MPFRGYGAGIWCNQRFAARHTCLASVACEAWSLPLSNISISTEPSDTAKPLPLSVIENSCIVNDSMQHSAIGLSCTHSKELSWTTSALGTSQLAKHSLLTCRNAVHLCWSQALLLSSHGCNKGPGKQMSFDTLRGHDYVAWMGMVCTNLQSLGTLAGKNGVPWAAPCLPIVALGLK